MGRPLEGAKPKLRVSITMDPDDWDTYKKLVATNLPPGTSVSSRIQNFVKKDIAALKGEETVNVADILGLQKRYDRLDKRLLVIQRSVEKRGAMQRFNKLLGAYDIDYEHYSNIREAIQQMLQDQNRKGSPVQEFLEGHPETDLSLVISVLEIRQEMNRTTQKILDAHKAKYLAAP